MDRCTFYQAALLSHFCQMYTGLVYYIIPYITLLWQLVYGYSKAGLVTFFLYGLKWSLHPKSINKQISHL
jgi:hypothetical protein